MALIKGRMICPNCGADTTFLTSAHARGAPAAPDAGSDSRSGT